MHKNDTIVVVSKPYYALQLIPVFIRVTGKARRHRILTPNKNTALLWRRINEAEFLVKSLSHKQMEPHLDADFYVCAEIQKRFPSGEGTGNESGALGNIFQNE